MSAGSTAPKAYPPFTPMNCRFFLVEGDPGSPSAFRFMMDLREDGGEEAGKRRAGMKQQPHRTVEDRRVFSFSAQLPVAAPSCGCTASADVCSCASSSCERSTPT